MRVDLPSCDLLKCRHNSDYNCVDENAYKRCKYSKLLKQLYEDGYIVENGTVKYKTEYLFSFREDKAKEDKINILIKDLWNLFIDLEQTHPSDEGDFQHGIHELQKVMGMRRLRRILPQEYPTYIKVNDKWSIQETRRK